LTETELAVIRGITREFASLSWTELAATICELLGWRRPNGGLKRGRKHLAKAPAPPRPKNSLPRGVAVPLRTFHRFQQPGVARAAHRQAGATGENGDPAVPGVRLDTGHPKD